MASTGLEVIAVVFHIGSSSKNEYDCRKNYFEMARNCILKILLRKMFSSSKDLISVIISGSEKTENDLGGSKDFHNIEVLCPFALANWDLVSELAEINPTNIHVNWLNAVVVGIQCLRDKVENAVEMKKTRTFISKKKLVLLCDFIDDVNDDQVDSIVAGFEDNDIELTIIGPDILKTIFESDDLSTSFDPKKSLTKSQQLACKIYNELQDKGTFCSCEEALGQLKYFTNKKTKRMPWNIDMSIGSQIAIRVSGYKMYSDNQPLKWNLRSSQNEPVQQSQAYFLGENELDLNDTVSGYLFGSTLVPCSEDDEVAKKYNSGAKSFAILFTVENNEVPKNLFMGNSPYYFVGHKDDEEAQCAVSALAEALYELNLVAITRKVYRDNCGVQIGALFPKVDVEPPALIFLELPFKRDIQKLWFPSLNKVSVSEEQFSAVDRLIDNMINEVSIYQDGDLQITRIRDNDTDPYEPENLLDPYEQYLLHCVATRGLQKEPVLPKSSDPEIYEVPNYIKELLLPTPEVVEKSINALEEINKLFYLEVVPPKVKVKSENDFNPNNVVKSEEDVSMKNDEGEVSNDRNITDLFHSVVLHVGTVNPESDFHALLSKGEQFESVCEQMETVIIDLIRRADNCDMIKKPLLCINLLRNKCIEKNRSDVYNDWVKKLKEVIFDIRQIDFWNKIVEEKLGLITVEEENSSSISLAVADEFLKYDNSNQKINDEDLDIDEMMDMI